jgi:hypothetical protein
MREVHAKCVRFTHFAKAVKFDPRLFWDFFIKTGLAPSMLKETSNTVDSLNGLVLDLKLSATNKLKNQQRL